MNCLLIAATVKEIAPFLEYYRNNNKLLQVDVLITGIGLTATSYYLTKQINLKRPRLVIQAGVAGCFNKQFTLGTVVTVKQDTIADESLIELKKLKTLFDLKLAPPNQFPYKKGWLVNTNVALIKKTQLKAVKGISVNQITTSGQKIRIYEKKFAAVVESMEGAALHYVCLMEKISFLQLRGISNYIGERNKKKWNMKDSINNLNKELIRILQDTSY